MNNIPKAEPGIPRPFDVVVIGEINPDLVLRGNVTPAFGQVEQLVQHATLAIGSSSAIFACGAARLGLKVAFIGKVGDDVFGHFMVEALTTRGIDTSGVVIDTATPTGFSVILVREGDRAILTFPGTMPALRFDEINPDIWAGARHLHLGSYFLLDALRPDVARLFARAQDSGLSVSLDTNYDPAERWAGVREVLQHTDVFMPNRTECLAISGESTLPAALDRLAGWGAVVAVKDGAQGAHARRGDTSATAKPLVVDVVDTVGAGDSFDAGFVYGYLAGWDLQTMLRMGIICGSLSTRGASGTTAQPTLDEAQAWLQQGAP